MTQIKFSCDQHGYVVVEAEDVILDEDDTYFAQCPVGNHVVRKRMDDKIAGLLLSAGSKTAALVLAEFQQELEKL